MIFRGISLTKLQFSGERHCLYTFIESAKIQIRNTQIDILCEDKYSSCEVFSKYYWARLKICELHRKGTHTSKALTKGERM